MANAKTDRAQRERRMIQFNTRISLRQRDNLDAFMEYMSRPEIHRIEESATWPDSITAIVDDALSQFFAEHPRRPRKGPKMVVKKQDNTDTDTEEEQEEQ